MNPYTGSQTKTHKQEDRDNESDDRGDDASHPENARGLSDSFVSMLARNWQILAGALLLGLAGAGIYSYYQNPTYRAETTLLVRSTAPMGGVGSSEALNADPSVAPTASDGATAVPGSPHSAV